MSYVTLYQRGYTVPVSRSPLTARARVQLISEGIETAAMVAYFGVERLSAPTPWGAGLDPADAAEAVAWALSIPTK